MKNELEYRIKHIEQVVDISPLLTQIQDESEVRDYYKKNRFAYLIFHNFRGYLHMGISENNVYDAKDLEVALNQINKAVCEYGYTNIIELGSGRGANAFYLASKNPDTNVLAVDLSTKPLAKYQSARNLKFIKGDFHKLSFLPDESADLIFGIETFCHSNNKSTLFSEIHRVLKPGGRLYMFDGYRTVSYHEDKIVEKACALVEHGMAVHKFETLAKVEAQAIKAGLALEKNENLSKKVLPTMRRFEKIALRFYAHPNLARIAVKLFPEKFVRNSVAGYLMSPLVGKNIMTYHKHIFVKRPVS